MQSLGARAAGPCRLSAPPAVSVSSAPHAPRPSRHAWHPTHTPLGPNVALEAKRAGRAGASGPDDEGPEVPAAARTAGPSGRGGADDLAQDLNSWRMYTETRTVSALKDELRALGAKVSGTKPELATRLAELLHAQYQRGERGRLDSGDEEEMQEQEAGDEEAEEEEAEQGDAASLERVLDWVEEQYSYPQLRDQLSRRGMSNAGKKAELQARLAQALLDEDPALSFLRPAPAAAAEAPAEEAAAPEQPAASSSAALESLLPELMSMRVAELVAELRSYGAPWKGTKEELARRLAGLMLEDVEREVSGAGEAGAAEASAQEEEEEFEEGEEEYEAAEGAEEEDEYYEDEEEEAEEVVERAPARPAPPPRAPSLTEQQRLELVSAEAAVKREELKDVTRQQAYATLKELIKGAAYGSRAVLVDQLARALAERDINDLITAADTDPAAAQKLLEKLRGDTAGAAAAAEAGPPGGAPSGAIDYSRLTWVEVRRMRVEDMRAALTALGANSDGNKYEMMERLKAILMSRDAAAAAARGEELILDGRGRGGPTQYDETYEHVLGMTVRTLREQLDERGLPASGSRSELQARLIEGLRQEAGAARRVSSEMKASSAPPSASELAERVAAAADASAAADAEVDAEVDLEAEAAKMLAALAEMPDEDRAAAVLRSLGPAQLITLGGEAPVDVVVVAGCPRGRLDLAAQSLEAARAVLDQLYTAPMGPRPMGLEDLAGPMGHGVGPDAEDAGGKAEEEEQEAVEGEEEEEEGELVEVLPEEDWTVAPPVSAPPAAGAIARAASGVVVHVWWVDGATGAATLLSPAQLYGATVAELAAGVLPPVHYSLLAVPSPSPLSLDTPALEGPVSDTAADGAADEESSAAQASQSTEDGPTQFADVASLAAHLKASAHVVFPALPAGGDLYCAVQSALDAAGVAAVGSGAEAAAAAQDRVGVLRRLSELSYPVVPLLELTSADVAEFAAAADTVESTAEAVDEAQAAAAEAQEAGEAAEEGAGEVEASIEAAEAAAAALVAAHSALQHRIEEWCAEQGFNPQQQLFLLRPRMGAGAASASHAVTALGASRAAELAPLALVVLQSEAARGVGQAEEAAAAEAGCSIVLEPVPATGSAARFVCTVVEAPDGPVALLPAELELYDSEAALLGHAADVAEWEAMRDGADEQEVAAVRANILAVEPESWRGGAFDPHHPLPRPTARLRLHTPPRFSRKLIHAVRHAAARAFGQLGLRDAATLEGWVELPAGYAAAMEPEQDAPRTLYDEDVHILEKLALEEAERRSKDPAPMGDYYDFGSSWHADLAAFDPAVRLAGASNGEGATVRFAAVRPDLPLLPRDPAAVAAAELGLPPAALLRNLANSALRRAAEAGDRRAMLPQEPYVSPVVLDDEAEEGEVEEAEEGEGAEGEEPQGEVLELDPAPLQLPMPPQLPLYHTALMQHEREADEFDSWIEENDPDYWDDREGAERVEELKQQYEEELEEETGLPRGARGSANPMADDLAGALLVAEQKDLLDAAVEALGDFGAQLSAAMTSMPREEAIDEDLEITLYRTRELPSVDEPLPEGVVEGSQDDPRVAASLQVIGIAELAKRHGWEVLEAADAAVEEAERVAEREAAGLPPPTVEEAEQAALEAAAEQAVLEAMCANDDEVMELRTGMVTPVQIYLRFKARQARAEPRSHPLMIPAKSSATPFGEFASSGAGEGEDAGEGELLLDEDEEGPEEVLVVPNESGPDPSGPFGRTQYAHPATYEFSVPPDDAVELPAYASAGLIATGLAASGLDGGLVAAVASDAGAGLAASEAEALALMEMGYSAEIFDVDPESGLPILAAVGPHPDGLHQEVILDGFGRLASVPSFDPLRVVLQNAGIQAEGEEGEAEAADEGEYDAHQEDAGSSSPATREAADVDWDDEDGFSAAVAAAQSAGSPAAAGSRYGDDVVAAAPYAEAAAAALVLGDAEAAANAALAPPMAPTRLWVIVGGDGHAGREAGMAAGLNIMAKLERYQDLVVEPFLLAPLGEGRDEEERRAELLRRRTEYVAGLGMTHDVDLPPSLDLPSLRLPPNVDTALPESQRIYAVPLATVVRPSFGEALDSLERTQGREGVAEHALTELGRQQRQAHADTQAELAAAGIEGVSSLWDGDLLTRPGPPPARPLDLASFAEDAARAGAVVWVAGRSAMAEAGGLQGLLELNGVPCVGPASEQLSWLWDRMTTAEILEDLEDDGVDVPPRYALPYEHAVTVAQLSEEEADELLERLRDAVFGVEAAAANPGLPLLVRPLADTCGVGVARIGEGADLVTYAAAMNTCAEDIPANMLSYPHRTIPMPPLPPVALLFEPYVAADQLIMTVGAPDSTEGSTEEAGSTLSLEGSHTRVEMAVAARDGWLDVSFALVGSLGRMRCLPPLVSAAVVSEAAVAQATAQDEATEAADPDAPRLAVTDLLVHAPVSYVCPPPAAAIEPEALAEACVRVLAVCDRLALRGLVQVEAFVSVEDGTVAVYDINGLPYLGPDSGIWRQAAAAGMLPQDLLRSLIGLAIEARAEPDAAQSTFDQQLADMDRQGVAWDADLDEQYGDDEDEYGEVEVEGGAAGEDEDEAYGDQYGGMLDELEEMRAGGEEEEGEEGLGEEEEEAGSTGRGQGGYAAEEEGGELYFDDEEGGDEEGYGGGRAAGGVGGGYMGLGEASSGGRGGGPRGRGGRGSGDDDLGSLDDF